MRLMLLLSSMHAGGAERVAATLVNAWSARGDSVTLVPTFSAKGECFYPVSPAVELLWLADLAGVRHRGPASSLARLRALRRLVRERRPDVVVSFLTNVNVAAILATRGLKVPLIVCERTNPAAGRQVGGLWPLLRRLSYPYADLVTVQAEATVAPFRRMVPGVKRIETIPNPLPPELAQAASRELAATGALAAPAALASLALPGVPGVPDVPGARMRLTAMGRLVPQKQFGLLIDVFAQIAAAHPEWDLWIWGDGPDRAALARRIARHGLAGRIRLAGRTETPWDALAAGQVFVLTSEVEGFPNVLLEAMALGLPCASFDCPSGPREMMRAGQDGLLVPAGDRQALAQALQRLLGDADLRRDLGARAAASVRARYALPAVLAQWDALFESVGALEPVDAQPEAAAARPRAGEQS